MLPILEIKPSMATCTFHRNDTVPNVVLFYPDITLGQNCPSLLVTSHETVLNDHNVLKFVEIVWDCLIYSQYVYHSGWSPRRLLADTLCRYFYYFSSSLVINTNVELPITLRIEFIYVQRLRHEWSSPKVQSLCNQQLLHV